MAEQQMNEEQMKELQEKLKNMSPEELREFQKKQCIFCHIIDGKVQSKVVYEDATVVGILDINPSNPGHVLLLPKEHYAIMPQVPGDVLKHMATTSQKISQALLKGLDAQGTNILVANGMAAGQKAQHFMIHIIPRREDDSLEFTLPQRQLSDEILDPIQEKLAAALGYKVPEPVSAHPFNIPQKIVEVSDEEHKEREKAKKPETTKKETEIEIEVEGKPASIEITTKNNESEKEKPAKKDEEKKEGKIDLDDIADLLGK